MIYIVLNCNGKLTACGRILSTAPSTPSSVGLPSRLSRTASSAGVTAGGFGPPPVLGALASDTFFFAENMAERNIEK